jgi:hypothetical protein
MNMYHLTYLSAGYMGICKDRKGLIFTFPRCLSGLIHRIHVRSLRKAVSRG